MTDNELKGLLKNNLIKKILLFFNENPRCIDTAKGISIWVGSDALEVQKALNKLAKLKILISHETSFTSAYAYTNDRAIIKKIERLLKNAKRSF